MTTQITEQLVARIVVGGLDSELEVIGRTVAERLDYLQRVAAAQLRLGDPVRVKTDVRPRYLAGLTGRVSGWSGERVMVKFDEEWHYINPRLRREWRMSKGSIEATS